MSEVLDNIESTISTASLEVVHCNNVSITVY